MIPHAMHKNIFEDEDRLYERLAHDYNLFYELYENAKDIRSRHIARKSMQTIDEAQRQIIKSKECSNDKKDRE